MQSERSLTAIVLLILLAAHQARAIDFTFDVAGPGTDDWWITGNWTPAGIPNSENDRAIFNNAAGGTTNLHPENPTVQEILFDTPTGWTIFNNNRNLNLNAPGAGPALITQNNSGVITIDSDLFLVDNTIVGGTGTGAINANGSLLDSRAFDGPGSLTKTGTFTLNINDPSFHTGGTTVTQGTLTANHSSALGSGALTMNGGTLNTSVNLNNNIILNNTTNTFAPNGNYRQLNGQISGPGGFTVAGGGGTPGLELTNSANNFGGNITINSGTYLRLTNSEVIPNTASITNNGNLRLDTPGGGTETIAGLSGSGSVWIPAVGSPQTLVVGANDASSTFTGTMGQSGQNNAGLSLTKIGNGTFALTNAGNLFSGGLTVADGTLRVTSIDNAGVASAAGAGNTITLGSTGNVGTLYVNSGVTHHTVNRNFVLTGDGGGITYDQFFSINGIVSGPGDLFVNGSVGGSDLAGHRFSLQNAGNNFGGDVFIQSGTLQVGVANTIPDTATVNVSAGAKFRLNATETIEALNGAGRVITFNGTAQTLTVGSNNGSGNFTGTIENPLKLIKIGNGTQVLSGLNTFTGGVDINGGVLEVTTLSAGATASALGASSGVSSNLIFDGGTLRYTGGTVGGINRAFKLEAGGGTIEITNPGATVTWTDAAGAGPINDGFSGAGTLTKAGPGTLNLVGANTYTAGTVVSQGTLIGGHNLAFGPGTITLNDANTGANNTSLFLSGDVDIANNIVVANQGTGTVTIGANDSGGNNTFTGTVQLNRATTLTGDQDRTTFTNVISGNVGTLTIARSPNLGGATTGRVTMENNNTFTGDIDIQPFAILQVGRSGTPGNQIPDAGNVNIQANGQLWLVFENESINGLTGSGTATFFSGGGLGATTLTVGAGNNPLANFSGSIQDNGGTAMNLVKTGTGTQVLSGASTYTGTTTISQGTLVAANSSALGSGGVVLNDASTGSNNTFLLIDSTAGSVNISNAINITNNGSGTTTIGTSATSGGNFSIFSGPITLAKDVTLQGAPAGGDRTQFSGGISGTGNVTISGNERVLFLGAANTFNGDISINPGSILQLGEGVATATSFIPDASDVSVGAGGFLRLAKVGNSETIGGLSGTGTVEAFGSNNTLIVGSGGATATFDGLLRNNGGVLSLTKTGGGTQTLTNPGNSFTGKLTIEGGTLSTPHLAAGNTPSAIGAFLGTSPNFEFNGGTLQYTGGTVGGINRAFLISAGGATIEVTNPATTLTWTDASGAGPITGPGSLTKTGPGTLQLAGANNYTGGTIVSQGTLLASNSAALGSGLATINDANTGANNTSLLASAPVTINNNITVANLGSGTTTIGTTNFITGVNTQFGGTLTLNKDVTLQAGSSDRTTFAGQITGTGNITITSPFAADRRIVFDRPAGAANDFVGDITLGASANLQLGVANSIEDRTLPDATNINFNAGSRLHIAPAASDFENMGILHSLSPGAGVVDLITGSGFTLNVGNSDDSGTFSGVIQNTSGNLTLVKGGTGTQTLTGVNTYNGVTFVGRGTLELAGSGSINNTTFLSVGLSTAIPGADTLLLNNNITHDLGTGDVVVGFVGDGLIRQNTGNATIHGQLRIGEFGETGTYELNAGSLTSNNEVILGFSSNPGVLGIFDHNNGTHAVNGLLTVGLAGAGNYNLNDGTLNSNLTGGNSVVVGTGATTAAFTQIGGTHNVADDLTIGSAGVYTLSGGTLDFQDNLGGSPTESTLAITTGGNFDFTGGQLLDVTFIDPTTGGNGTFTQNGGDFIVGRDNSGPGPVTTTILGNYLQTASNNATLSLDIFGQFENDIDMLIVNGDVDMAGALSVDLAAANPIPFQWYNAVKTTGEFDTISFTGTTDAQNWRIIDNPNGPGQILQIAVPEPAGLLLWGLLAAGLGLHVRRRRRK